jgi:hypothetical protein
MFAIYRGDMGYEVEPDYGNPRAAWIGDVRILKDHGGGRYLCEWDPGTVRPCQRGQVVLRLYGGRFRVGDVVAIMGDDVVHPGCEPRFLQWRQRDDEAARPAAASSARGS